MPVTTTTAGTYDALLSSTLTKYVQKYLEDVIFKDLVFFYCLTNRNQKGFKANSRGVKSNKRVLDGGESITFPIMYEANSTVGSYSGYDLLDTTPQDGQTIAQVSWKECAGSVSISGREEAMNSDSETKMFDLLKSKIQQLEMSLSANLSVQMWSDGTGNTNKDITGLQAIVANTPTTGTYAGINRASYSWWRNKYQNAMGSFAAGGVGYWRTMFNNLTKGQTHPQLIITTQTVHEYYEDVLEAGLRRTNNDLADAGFANIDFKGAPVVFDGDGVSGSAYFLNFDFLKWAVHRDVDFTNTPFQKPENQNAKVSQILVMGNLYCTNPRFQGVITGITA